MRYRAIWKNTGPTLAGVFLVAAALAQTGTPQREYIRLGGRVVAIESPSAGNPPLLQIDNRPSGQSVASSINLKGWALDSATQPETAITSVTVKVDNGVPQAATTGLPRQDACDAYPNRPGCPNVGWSYSLPTENLSNGTHTIAVTATDGESTPKTTTQTFTVQVNNPPQPPVMYIDTPVANQVLHDSVLVGGWAVDSAPNVEGGVDMVSVNLGGGADYPATYGANRPDVCASYPNRANCPYVGWNMYFDTRLADDGSQTLRVRVWDLDLPVHQSAERTVNVTVSNPTVPPAGQDVCSNSQAVDGYPNNCYREPAVTATAGTLDVYARGVIRATPVVFPAWSDFGGQDDIVWYEGVNVGQDPDYGGDLWKATINLANHRAGNPDSGRIYVHTYMVWNSGGSEQWLFLAYGDFIRYSPKVGVNGGAVLNPGFETGQLTNWTPFAYTQQSVTSVAHGGTWGLRQWSGYGGVYQDFRGLIPGQEYRVSAWVRAESGTVNVELWAHDTFDVNKATTGMVAVGAAWQQLNIAFTATTSGAIRIHLYKNDVAGVVFWDDVVLQAPASQNPSYETGNLTSWTVYPNPGQAAVTNAKRKSGTSSVRIDAGPVDDVYQDIDGLVSGRTYQIEVWMKGDVPLSDTGQVWLHDSTGGNPIYGNTVLAINPEWRRIRVNYTANSTGKVRVHLKRVTGAGALYWDDTTITRLP